jgi:hypothetical protein
MKDSSQAFLQILIQFSWSCDKGEVGCARLVTGLRPSARERLD